MKFIQVKDGIAIAIDSIKMVRKSGDFSCKIHTSSDVYEVDIPYTTLMSILETGEMDNRTLEKIYNVMRAMGTPAP